MREIFNACRPQSSHSSKEILVISASLATCDPEDVNTIIPVRPNISILVVEGSAEAAERQDFMLGHWNIRRHASFGKYMRQDQRLLWRVRVSH